MESNWISLYYFSPSTVKKRRRALQLKGSRGIMRDMDEAGLAEAEQLVLNELSKDPAQRAGSRTIQAKIAYNSSLHLPR